MLDINNVNKELGYLRKTNAKLKERIQKLESNQNMPSVQAAESHKSHKEHKQKKKMFSCSDCDKKFSQIKFLRTTLKPIILKTYRMTKCFLKNVQSRIHR